MRATKVGFDFDGVLYYNPTRVIRPIIYFIKKHLLKKRIDRFYIPQHTFSKKIIGFLHKSSFRPNRGFADFKALLNNPRYQVYIITARFNFIKDNLMRSLRKANINPKKIAGVFQNLQNEQPHLFKEKIIKKLKLDYFVEDNWDIVRHLTKTVPTKVIWVYNLIDWLFIKYQPRVKDLKEAINYLEKKRRLSHL